MIAIVAGSDFRLYSSAWLSCCRSSHSSNLHKDTMTSTNTYLYIHQITITQPQTRCTEHTFEVSCITWVLTMSASCLGSKFAKHRTYIASALTRQSHELLGSALNYCMETMTVKSTKFTHRKEIRKRSLHCRDVLFMQCWTVVGILYV